MGADNKDAKGTAAALEAAEKKKKDEKKDEVDPVKAEAERKEEKKRQMKLAEQARDVVVHPIVLLSIVDHYTRSAKGTSKRVIGCLLGEVPSKKFPQTRDNKIHLTTSFAVPFEEETRDPSVWFLDHNYLEELAHMFKKCNAKERIVGWYSSGPKIKPADIQIHELLRKYCPQPVFLIQQVVESVGAELPMEAYYSVPEKTFDKVFKRTFKMLPVSYAADEAEDVGVEHLLRDLQNQATHTLSSRIQDKSAGLKTLIAKLKELAEYLDMVLQGEDRDIYEGLAEYLDMVLQGKFPYNPVLIDRLQDISLPDMSSMAASLAEETNDQHLGIYIGSMIRGLIAMHNLVKNKLKNKAMLEEEVKKDVKKDAAQEAKDEKKEFAKKFKK